MTKIRAPRPTRSIRSALGLAVGLAFAWPAAAAPDTAKDQVFATESAFARSMADRSLQRFSEFIADDAVFFSGTTAQRGKAEIVAEWATYFSGPDAPFSWEPDQVEVLASGTLAMSTGPVRDRSGHVFARFNSVWRLDGLNRWRIVFDKGAPPSPGPKAP
ncbi:MAG: nuclear transport factor 2 family protein [Pseudomonadota bacterium]|nr:nuclear transport factor 2 family protein [Pseudomonadota bacterium]